MPVMAVVDDGGVVTVVEGAAVVMPVGDATVVTEADPTVVEHAAISLNVTRSSKGLRRFE